MNVRRVSHENTGIKETEDISTEGTFHSDVGKNKELEDMKK